MKINLRTQVLTISSAAILLTGLSACGEEEKKAETPSFADQSVEEIQEQALAAMEDVNSMRVAGDVTDEGQQLSLDLAMDREGTCVGSIGAEGGTAEIINSDDGFFLKGDNTFWVVSLGSKAKAKEMLSFLGDKWAKVPGGDAEFDTTCDLDGFLAELGDSNADDSEVGDETEVDGTKAVEVISGKGGSDETTVWVATEEPHYVLQVSQKGIEEGTITFSDFDEEVEATAPEEGEFVDLT
jgi:hypothetical protein